MRMTWNRSRPLGVVLAASALASVAACGSTVQLNAGAAGGTQVGTGLSDDGLGLGVQQPTSAPSLGGGSTPSSSTPIAVEPTATGSDSDVSSGGPAAGDGPTTGGAQVANGPGVTATTVKIGVAYRANADEANAAAGGAAITSGNPAGEAKIIIDDINAHGGVGGRKLVPVFYAYNAQSGQSYATQDQAACSAFTEDDHVFAVIGSGLTTGFAACIEKSGASIIAADIVRFDARDYTSYPHVYDIQGFEVDRMVTALAHTITTNGYLGGWNAKTGTTASTKPTIGILTFDSPELKRGVQRLLPLLAAAGAKVKTSDITYISNPTGPGDLASDSTAVQNSVVRMRGNGVDHLIVLDTNGGMSQLLLTFAQYQLYFPRYAVESGSGLQAYLESGLIPKQQLGGVVGMGWMPMLDLPASTNPDNGPYSGPARRRCTAIMKAAGVSFTSSNAKSIAYLLCDQITLVRDGMARVSGALTNESLQHAIEGLGTSFDSASLGASRLSAGKHSVVARAFAWVYDSPCGCMAYGRRTDVR